MKNIFKKISFVISFILIVAILCCGCNTKSGDEGTIDEKNNGSTNQDLESEIVDDNEVEEIEEKNSTHNFTLQNVDGNTYTFSCEDEGCSETASFTATCDKGTSCISVTDSTITFGTIESKTAYTLSGTFYGNIVIDVSEDYAFELDLTGFTIISETEVPIMVTSCDGMTISAKSDTKNYIYDLRETVDEDVTSASVYCACDLDIKGNGELYIKSQNNNGIHAKDELNIKNLTLQVEVADNAIKGNDGVTIESGTITLIADQGDGIKTSNSHLSKKGKQKGDIYILGGDILIYSACDGIDSAHDVFINESKGEVDLQIFTDRYSKYSKEVTAVSDSVIYVKYSATTYKYSIEYTNETDTVWYNSSSYTTKSDGMGGFGGMGGTQYYYAITKPAGFTQMRLFIYDSADVQGQAEDYVACSDYLTINSGYDTLAISNRNSGLSLGWTNYTTTGMGGGMTQEGNTDKGDYSTKGIKADNEIEISAGDITISAYDDAIHTNNDVELGEEGAYYYGTGNIEISGGEIVIHSNDDGIHADGTLTIGNAKIDITNCYEGLEGTIITLSDGETSIISKDDGINATATTGEGIVISGGKLYVYAGGDGLDSNTTTNYKGIVFNDGQVVVISSGNGDSSLDTEKGYTYNGGYVVAIGGGMSRQEAIKCSNFSSVGTSKNQSFTKDNYLLVEDVVIIKMPKTLSFVVVLGDNNATLASATEIMQEVDSNGVVWLK